MHPEYFIAEIVKLFILNSSKFKTPIPPAHTHPRTLRPHPRAFTQSVNVDSCVDASVDTWKEYICVFPILYWIVSARQNQVRPLSNITKSRNIFLSV